MNKKIFLIFSLLCPTFIFSSDGSEKIWNLASGGLGGLFYIHNRNLDIELKIKQKNERLRYNQANLDEPHNQILNDAKLKYKQAFDLGFSKDHKNEEAFSVVANTLAPAFMLDALCKTTLITTVLINITTGTNIKDTFKLQHAHARWDEGCRQAETISLQNIADFNKNDDYAIRNRQSLAKNNILIQREHELIDKMNATVLTGKGIDYSALNQLENLRDVGKIGAEYKEAQRIKNKIYNEQHIVKNKMQWAAVREEFSKPKLTAAGCLSKRDMTPDMTRMIISDFLAPTSNQIAEVEAEHTKQCVKTPLQVLHNMRDREKNSKSLKHASNIFCEILAKQLL